MRLNDSQTTALAKHLEKAAEQYADCDPTGDNGGCFLILAGMIAALHWMAESSAGEFDESHILNGAWQHVVFPTN